MRKSAMKNLVAFSGIAAISISLLPIAVPNLNLLEPIFAQTTQSQPFSTIRLEQIVGEYQVVLSPKVLADAVKEGVRSVTGKWIIKSNGTFEASLQAVSTKGEFQNIRTFGRITIKDGKAFSQVETVNGEKSDKVSPIQPYTLSPDGNELQADGQPVKLVRTDATKFAQTIQSQTSSTNLAQSMSAKAYNNRGLLKYYSGDGEGAIFDYNEAIRINPNYYEAYNNRGLSKYYSGDHPEGAISDYNEAIRINPNYVRAYARRGLAFQRLQKNEQANSNFKKAISLFPKTADDYLGRGVAKFYLGDNQGAITEFTEAIRINPNDYEAYFNRGYLKYPLGDKIGAVSDFDKAIRINPDYFDAYKLRGYGKYGLGDKQGAIADYTEAIRINPNSSYYEDRGIIKYELGDKQGAIADYTEAIRINPHASSYIIRGNVKYELGDKQGAISDFNEVIRINSNYFNLYHYDAYNNRGIIKYELGDTQGATVDFNEAIRINPYLVKQQAKLIRYNLGKGLSIDLDHPF